MWRDVQNVVCIDLTSAQAACLLGAEAVTFVSTEDERKQSIVEALIGKTFKIAVTMVRVQKKGGGKKNGRRAPKKRWRA